jgi:hypothetical protein
MYDVTDLRSTIVPKSDQLNAEQLLGGPLTVTVTDVRIGSSDEQPISIHYENDGGRPFKPCKTMRKVLVFAWGQNGRDWIGRAMTLYNDPAVKFGGMEVGGIRISHMTDIERDVQVSLTATKGKKALHTIRRLDVRKAPKPDSVDHDAEIAGADTVDALKAAFAAAYRSTREKARRDGFKSAYDTRMAEMTSTDSDLDALRMAIDEAGDIDTAQRVLDSARDTLSAADMDELQSAFNMAWGT